MQHEIQGQYATAVIYGNYPDATEIRDLYAMLSVPAFEGAKIRIMPDHHAGKGCMIGFTCPIDMLDPKIVPNMIGVDIGCGVLGVRIPQSRVPLDRAEQFAAFDKHLRENMPFGMRDRESMHPDLEELYHRYVQPNGWDSFKIEFDKLIRKIGIKPDKAHCSLGSLGSGNHFAELGEEILVSGVSTGNHMLTIHSGSRNFGLQVCNYHQRIAQGNHGARKDLAWLEGADALEYLHDMRIAQKFASLNRWVMVRTLLGAFKIRLHEKLEIERDHVLSIHNFIGDDNCIRKGAISARTGEPIVIPWNMAEGLVVGVGKGNPDWNYSAPHGAGRLMSRGDCKRTLDLAEYKKQMADAGIWSSCVDKDTLDEAPNAYRPAASVAAEIVDTVEVQATIKTRYNFKASK